MSNLPYEGLLVRFDVSKYVAGIEETDNWEELFKGRIDDFLNEQDELRKEEYKICVFCDISSIFKFSCLAEDYIKEKGKYAYTMKCSAKERMETYIRFMNEDEEKGCGLRVRYLFNKIFQAAVDIRYTEEEKRELFDLVVKNALSQEDIRLKALDLVCAYKIAKFNGYDLSDVPIVRLEETYKLIQDPRPLTQSMIELLKKTNRYEKDIAFYDEISQPDKEALEIFNIQMHRFKGGRNFFSMKS